VSEKAEDIKMAFLRLAGTNERIKNTERDIEARLVDIEYALPDQTEEVHRYVFAVRKTRILFEGDFRSLLPKACLRRH
jgi:hypothetical protein